MTTQRFRKARIVSISLIFLLFSLCVLAQPAGTLPKSVEIKVTGAPADPETLWDAITVTLYQKVRLLPGSTLLFFPSAGPELSSLPVNQKRVMTLRYVILGDGYEEQNDTVKVTLKNIGVMNDRPSLLFVSNKPEKIDASGIFENVLPAKTHGRFVYYHQSPFRNFSLSLIAVNPHQKNINLWISKSVGGPSQDTIFSGHVSAKEFMKKRLSGAGFWLEVLPGETLEILSQRLKTHHTVSGMLSLYNKSDEALTFQFIAIADELGSEGRLMTDTKVLTKADHNRGGIFSVPHIEKYLSLSLNQKAETLRIGDQPALYDQVSHSFYKGNYGVDYVAIIFLDNRGNRASRVFTFSLIPNAGLVRGSFSISGEMIETPLLKNQGEPFIFKRITVPADEARLLNLKTCPEPGSYYPATVLIRAED